jgi:hypothetical protein
MRAFIAIPILALVLTCLLRAEPEWKIVDGVRYHIIRAPAASVKIVW